MIDLNELYIRHYCIEAHIWNDDIPSFSGNRMIKNFSDAGGLIQLNTIYQEAPPWQNHM